jgi:tetratricopeptide (TPR) repeat protein
MPTKNFSDDINRLFRQDDWEEARRLLENARENDPMNHWLLTQLGVTFYEQKKYMDALRLFLASQKIVEECPLTLWNLAGTFDSLGDHMRAVGIYTWILRSKKSVKDDPCWESKQWSDALKTDAVYRIGCCFQSLGKKKKAEQCFRNYLDLLSIGIQGTYPAEDAIKKILSLHSSGERHFTTKKTQEVIELASRVSAGKVIKGKRNRLPSFDLSDIEALAGRRVASQT